MGVESMYDWWWRRGYSWEGELKPPDREAPEYLSWSGHMKTCYNLYRSEGTSKERKRELLDSFTFYKSLRAKLDC